MKKRNGFTLVELLAVIVILAIILVIAVPQIMNTINSARLGAFRSTAKLILTAAEKEYLVQQTLGDTSFNGATVECSDVVELSADYDTTTTGKKCTVSFDASGNAKVVLYGSDSGKFKGYDCGAGATLNGESDSVEDLCKD